MERTQKTSSMTFRACSTRLDRLNRPASINRQSTRYAYRNVKRIDTVAFEDALRRSALFTSPATSTDGYAGQFADIVSPAELNKVSPLRMATRRQPKLISRWLSTTAISSKHERRRLEKVWKRSAKESDRLAYRAECRRANKLINESCRDHNSRRINACSDSKSRWAAVRELLHSDDFKPTFTEEKNVKLCNSFYNYFITKIVNLKQSITSRLTSTTLPPPLSNPI